MAQQTTGRAALVANNLPTTKTVTGATNATPIVVTTSTPHNVKTNEIIRVSGVGGNTAANGDWIAGAVTSTTVALLAYPGGTNSTGSGAYTSGGSLISKGFGITVPVPNDLTDMMRAGMTNVPFEASLDRDAYLMYTKLDVNDGSATGTLTVEDLTVTGNTILGDASTDDLTVMADAVFNGQTSIFDSASTATFQGVTGLDGTTTVGVNGTFILNGKMRIKDPYYAADANITLDTATGSGAQCIVFLTSPAANRTVTLRQTTGTIPPDGYFFDIVAMMGTSNKTIAVQREGAAGTYVVTLGDGVGTSPYGANNLVASARVQKVSGVWRLVDANGYAFYGADA